MLFPWKGTLAHWYVAKEVKNRVFKNILYERFNMVNHISEVENQTNNLIDKALDGLNLEAKSLFVLLDNISSNFLKVEKSLKDLKANFPFREPIKKNTTSPKIPRDDHRSSNFLNLEYYVTEQVHYLAWEADDEPKNYRLFLICEESEIVGCTGVGECCKFSEVFTKKCIFKKLWLDQIYRLN